MGTEGTIYEVYGKQGKSVCHSHGLFISRIDEIVLKKLNRLADSDKLVKMVVKRLNQKYKADNKPIEMQINQLKKELFELEERKDKLVSLFEVEAIDLSILRNRMASLAEEETHLKSEIQLLETKLTHVGSEHVTEGLVKAIMQQFKEAYQKAMTKEQRKQLLHLLIDEIIINGNKDMESIRN